MIEILRSGPGRGAIALLLLSLLMAGGVRAQSGKRSMIVMDDGQQRRALSYAQPDVDLALEPDVVLSDVRLFDEELSLSEAQRHAAQKLIEAYLASFAELCTSKNPDRMLDEGGVERSRFTPKPKDAPGEEKRSLERDERDVMHDIMLEEFRKAGFEVSSLDDLPFEPRVSIGIAMHDPDEPGAAPEPDVDVSLSLGTSDDSLTDETRAKLQAAADRIVPRLTEAVRAQVRERMAGGPTTPAAPDQEIAKKWQEVQALRAAIDDLVKEKRRLWQKLVVDLRALLADEQLERWPALERRLTRVKTLPRGRLDGESTDLIALTGDLDLPDAQSRRIAELLGAYEIELDQALRRRNTLLEDADARIDLALYEGKPERALSVANDVTQSRKVIRSLNDQYRDAMAALLDEAEAARFRAEALADGYPRVYRETLGQRAFERALALKDLNDELRGAIGEMQSAYTLQLAELNDRIARAIRRQQSEDLRRSIEKAVAVMQADSFDTGPDEEAAIAADFRLRQQLDARTMRTVYDLLTPEQVAQLPGIPTVDLAEPVTAEHIGLPLGGEE